MHYLAKWPQWAFVNALTLAERGLATRRLMSDSLAEPASKSDLFYVSYSDPARRGSQTFSANSYGWYGNGDVVFLDRTIRFTAWRHWRRRAYEKPARQARGIVVNNYVFIGSASGNLYALDAASGQQVWTKNLGAAIPATDENTLAIYSGLAAGDGLLVVPNGTK